MAADYRSQMEARVIERAIRDESFRQQLVEDPHTALQQVLGVSLPGSVSIEVLEETPGTMYLVLPPAEAGSRELSEQEVASVAGGGITWSSASNQRSC
jgi:nitrile hydratase alpha subunit